MRARVVIPLVLLPPAVSYLLLTLTSARAAVIAAGVLAIFSLLVSLPVGLCASTDFLASVRHRGRFASVVHEALRVPVFLLGIVALLIGVIVVGWIVFGVLSLAFGKGVRDFGLRQLLSAPMGLAVMYGMIWFGFALVRLSLRRVRGNPDPWNQSDPLAKRTKPWNQD